MSRQAGAVAERAAEKFLHARGYSTLVRNYTCRGGEIDLVCEHGEALVFVEVRARSRSDFGTPEETVTTLKQRRILRAAEHFLARHKLSDRICRFDVIAIAGDELTHLVDAFS